MTISQIGRSIAASATLKLNETAAILREKGEPVIQLGGGEPKSKAPLEAFVGVANLLNTGEVRYAPADGIPALKKAVIRYTKEFYGSRVAPENVIASGGARGAGARCLSGKRARTRLAEPRNTVDVPNCDKCLFGLKNTAACLSNPASRAEVVGSGPGWNAGRSRSRVGAQIVNRSPSGSRSGGGTSRSGYIGLVHQPGPPPPDAAVLIDAAAGGDREAADRLLPLVYDQLRKAAQMHLASERCGHTLSATALVHDAYLKLVGPREVAWASCAHFYAAAAEAMRRILLDHAKARGRLKRGGGLGRINLDDTALLGGPVAEDRGRDQADFVALEAAVCRLGTRDPRMAEVVRLRFYAGLEISQVALALGVSERTVKNDWAFAKAWLEREMKPTLGEAAERESEGSS